MLRQQQQQAPSPKAEAALDGLSSALRLLACLASANASLALALAQMRLPHAAEPGSSSGRDEPDLVTLVMSTLSVLPQLPAAARSQDLLSSLGSLPNAHTRTFVTQVGCPAAAGAASCMY